MCRSKGTEKQGGKTKLIGSYVDTERDELPLYTINSKLNKPFLVDLQVKGKVITFEVDTGAAVTIMSSDNFRHHFPNETISNSTLQLMTYTRDKLPMIGEVRLGASELQ